MTRWPYAQLAASSAYVPLATRLLLSSGFDLPQLIAELVANASFEGSTTEKIGDLTQKVTGNPKLLEFYAQSLVPNSVEGSFKIEKHGNQFLALGFRQGRVAD